MPQERGLDGYVVTLSRSSVEPFLQFSDRRDLREKVFRAFIMRGDNGGATDNKAIIAETVRLRAERAASPRLCRLRPLPARRRHGEDAGGRARPARYGLGAGAQERAGRSRRPAGADRRRKAAISSSTPWDWRYYAEKLRQQRCDFDEAAIKPYLDLDRMIEAAFYTAQRLFGLTFQPRTDVPVWHPDVRVWEVRGRDGKQIGLFFGDYFARASKRSGAWMTSLRDQEKLAGDVRPLIVNVCNFSKAADGEPTLLSFDDARTLFHEFGHALHGLLSDVTYPTISGTNVATDFVELPSQLYEHWLEQPEVLRRFALHYQTGEPMPEDLLQRLIAARNFNQGFATVEYVACAFVDLDFHSLVAATGGRDRPQRHSRTSALARIGMPDEIVMRHRPPHFAHVFSGGGYAAGYYSYMWSEVLDADAFEAFEETGDIFDPATAKRLHDFDLRGRRLARSGRSLQGVPRPAAERGRAACASAASPSRVRRTPRRAEHHGPAQRRPSPRRRLRAALRRRRSRPRDPRRRRQCDRGHAGDGGHDRRGLSAHEPSRRRRLLADPRAVAAACAPSWRRGRPAASAAASFIASTRRSRRADRLRRSRCRARSAAGCWRTKRPRRYGGKLPLDVLLASGHRPCPQRLYGDAQPEAADAGTS